MLGVRVPPGLLYVAELKGLGNDRVFAINVGIGRMIKKGIVALRSFFTDLKNELLKVTFPSKQEAIGLTTVVIVFTIIVSVFLAIIDVVLVRLLRFVV